MIKGILFIALKNSYGKKKLGEALNKKAHSDMLKAIGYEVENIWIDDYESNDKLQEVILSQANEFQPNIIFFKIFKFEIQFNTLEKLRERCFLVNWFGDDQWRFENFTSKYANYFDVCITTDKFSIDKYKSIGKIKRLYFRFRRAFWYFKRGNLFNLINRLKQSYAEYN